MILEIINTDLLKSAVPIFTFSFLIGYVMDSVIALITIKSHRKIRLSGFRIHHNAFGYISILIGAFYYHSVLIGFGMGIILGHKIRNGILLFIEKVDTEIGRNKKFIERKIRRLKEENKRKLDKKINEIRKEYK